MLIQSDKLIHKNGELFLMGASPTFPESVEVQSSKTGRIVKFLIDEELAIQNEFWDGLMVVYVPVEECGIHRLTISCLD